MTRFADDFVIGCEREDDARRIMAVLPKRFARYGLTIHPQKTTMISFGRPDAGAKTSKGKGTFDFLGLTHFWAKSRKGNWVIKRKTAAPRVRRTVKAHWQWCRLHRHLPLKVQHQHLSQKLRGYYQYYGITGNYRMLQLVQRHVETARRFWLTRRSRTGAIDWDKFKRLQRTYALPVPRIVHQI